MNLGRVIGSIWATRKHAGLDGTKMLLVQPLTTEQEPVGRPLAAFDAVGAGPGELVFYVLQYEATLAFPERGLVPIDAAITGIVDRMDDMTTQVLGNGPDVGKAGA